MANGRHSQQDRRAVVARVAAGEDLGAVCREVGISERTYYRWKARLVNGGAPDLVEELLAENRSLKRVIVAQALELQELREEVEADA